MSWDGAGLVILQFPGYGVDDSSVTPIKQKEGKLESYCFPLRPNPGPTVCSLEVYLRCILLKLRFLLSPGMRGMEVQSSCRLSVLGNSLLDRR